MEDMTNDIAFDLGAFNYPCFYDMAVWIPNKESFKYVNFFEWSAPVYSNLNWTFYGDLNERKFETLEHKHYYIKGRLSSYSVHIKDDSITVFYANSVESRNRFVKWAHELLIVNFGENEKWSIKKMDGGNTVVPNTPGLILNANKEIINYFTGVINEKISK